MTKEISKELNIAILVAENDESYDKKVFQLQCTTNTTNHYTK